MFFRFYMFLLKFIIKRFITVRTKKSRHLNIVFCRQWYTYMNTYKNTEICISTHILVSISQVYVQI